MIVIISSCSPKNSEDTSQDVNTEDIKTEESELIEFDSEPEMKEETKREFRLETKEIISEETEDSETTDYETIAVQPNSTDIDEKETEPDIKEDPNISNKEYKGSYLTEAGLTQVSKNKNIIVFIIDRFDISFYNSVVSEYPEFFKDLDGFTYFSDNISLYSRTWPGVVTMITGIDTDFSMNRRSFFEKAYPESLFLKDLKNNNYSIRLYIQNKYSYYDGAALAGIADNISIDNPDASAYDINDPKNCGKILREGLSLDSNENSYIFLHLNGCHTPCTMNANAEYAGETSSEEQLRGCFKMIYFYIDELKRLGVYDNSTIVITGDHPRAIDDGRIPWQPRLTALFIKPTNATGKLQYSSSQVSQDNLIPFLIESSGINTNADYGRSYFDIEYEENTVRCHKFQLDDISDQIVKFRIKGKGSDFKNWAIEKRTNIGSGFYN